MVTVTVDRARPPLKKAALLLVETLQHYFNWEDEQWIPTTASLIIGSCVSSSRCHDVDGEHHPVDSDQQEEESLLGRNVADSVPLHFLSLRSSPKLHSLSLLSKCETGKFGRTNKQAFFFCSSLSLFLFLEKEKACMNNQIRLVNRVHQRVYRYFKNLHLYFSEKWSLLCRQNTWQITLTTQETKYHRAWKSFYIIYRSGNSKKIHIVVSTSKKSFHR